MCHEVIFAKVQNNLTCFLSPFFWSTFLKILLVIEDTIGSCFIFNQQYTHMISKLKYSFLNQVLNFHSVICNITTSNRKILNKKVCLFLRVLADHLKLRVFLSLYLPEYMAKSWHMFLFFNFIFSFFYSFIYLFFFCFRFFS